MALSVNVTEHPGYSIAAVVGDVDGATAPELQEAVLAAAGPGCRLLLDMSQVAYMSSAGLRVMLLLYRQISANAGSKVVLVGLPEDVQETMAATGFLKFFTIADTLEDGAAALNK
ncbi:MAG: STAS domain-containing protein [Anaerolineae bacterium]|nr:STAS domain-containing protein [Anaerolineae bacterium]